MTITRAQLREMSPEALRGLSAEALSIAVEKLVEANDPDECMEQALQSLTSSASATPPPYMMGSYLVIPGIITENGRGTTHKCQLSTVKVDSYDHMWSWEESLPTLVSSTQTKNGSVRQSVSLHVPQDGIRIIRHHMTWNGERHERSSAQVWKYIDGAVMPDYEYTIPSLPPPTSQ